MNSVTQLPPIDLCQTGILPSRNPPLFRGQTDFKFEAMPRHTMEATLETLHSMEASGVLTAVQSPLLSVRFHPTNLLHAWRSGSMDLNCIAIIDPKEMTLEEWRYFVEQIHKDTLMSPNFYFLTSSSSGSTQEDYLRSNQEQCKLLTHRIDRLHYMSDDGFSVQTVGKRLTLLPDKTYRTDNACYKISDSDCSGPRGDGSHVYYNLRITSRDKVHPTELSIAAPREVAVLLHNALTQFLLDESVSDAKNLLSFAARKWGSVFVHAVGESVCSYSISHHLIGEL